MPKARIGSRIGSDTHSITLITHRFDLAGFRTPDLPHRKPALLPFGPLCLVCIIVAKVSNIGYRLYHGRCIIGTKAMSTNIVYQVYGSGCFI